MTRLRTVQVGVAVVLALVLGVIVHQVVPSHRAAPVATVGPLTGRHLQIPWWEEVKSYHSAPHQVTYVIPSDVLFSSGSSAIDSQGHAFLIGLQPKLRGAISVLVAGCTDPVGGVDSTYNVLLGTSRASSAVAVWESAGLPASLFHVTSWADTHPVHNTKGLDAQTIDSLDRRIVIIVTGAP